jgi:hypothetical protein
MAQRYPATQDAMRGISGVMIVAPEFGAVFAAVVGHLETYPRVGFAARD